MNLMELDVHLSKDGKVIIVHDADLGRMCGDAYLGRNIEEYDFEELPPMQREIPMHLSNGSYKLAEEEDGKFTLLEELFESND